MLSKTLANHLELIMLDISDNKLGNEYFNEIKDSIVSCNNLIEFSAAKNFLSKAMIPYVIANSQSMRILNLHNNTFNLEDGKQLLIANSNRSTPLQVLSKYLYRNYSMLYKGRRIYAT